MKKLKQLFSRRKKARKEKGMAVGELLVLTVPLCVLCMAVTSKFAATSSARTEGQWRTSLKVQQQTTKPCGMDGALTAPGAAVLADSKVLKAKEPIGVSLLNSMEAVGKKTVEEPTKLQKYYYQRTADHFVNDGIDQVTTSSTFVCNEAGDPGDSSRNTMGLELEAMGLLEAAKLFGKGPGVP